MGVTEMYKWQPFREIRAVTEMDLIRKGMEREQRRKKAMRETLVLLVAIVVAVCAAFWILR